MYINKISIKNFRPFKDSSTFEINGFNIPNDTDIGSGLNIFVGENGCGKTTLLDALTLPILGYKAESISLDDFYNKETSIKVEVIAEKSFSYDSTMPRVSYKAKGFEFEAKVRSREAGSYLSTIVVNDRRFIRADGETKPENGKPDLRLKVDNPWKGSRFTENDIVYLDKNRTFQIRSGTYNATRFDKVMEDYSYQYIKENTPIKDLDKVIIDKILTFENLHLKNALDKFQEIYGEQIRLSVVDNQQPFKSAFFASVKSDKHQIPLSNIGSGYEMIFTILYSYFLSKQSEKQLILLIDEPELHLHPSLQETFANLLIDFSKDSQIFITTHSPLLVKQIMTNDLPVIKVLLKESDIISESDIKDKKLSYLSANEINYIAFQLITEEYHNELYEELKNLHAPSMGIKDFDKKYFQVDKGEPADYAWMGNSNEVSLHTYVRNQIHHQGSCGKASNLDLKSSIEKMRQFL